MSENDTDAKAALDLLERAVEKLRAAESRTGYLEEEWGMAYYLALGQVASCIEDAIAEWRRDSLSGNHLRR